MSKINEINELEESEARKVGRKVTVAGRDSDNIWIKFQYSAFIFIT